MYNVCDAFFGAVVLLFVYFGFQTGSIVSVFFLASSFFGMWAANAYSAQLKLPPYLIFLASVAVFILAGFFLRGSMRKALLGSLDRFAGMLMGFALGVFVVALAFPLTHHFSKSVQAKAAVSYTATKVMPRAQKVLPALRGFSLGQEVARVREEIVLPRDLHLPKALTMTAEKKPATRK